MVLQLHVSYTWLGQYKNTQQKHIYIKRENKAKHHKTNKTLKMSSIETFTYFFRYIVATLNSKQGRYVIDAKHPKPEPKNSSLDLQM